MASNQNNGGGFMLWAINSIFSIFRNRKIRKLNKKARGVKQIKKVTTDTLLPLDSYQDNIIISGGGDLERLKFSERILQNSFAQKQTLVALHLGNSSLENVVAGNNLGIIASQNNKTFDPFTSFEVHEIWQVVVDTCKAKYGINSNGRYVLQVVHDLLVAQKIRPYFANFTNFNYRQIPSRINDCLSAGFITKTQANDLNSLLSAGQSEIAKIDNFFNDMAIQVKHIVASDPAKAQAQSVLSAIKFNKTICLDLQSSANTMLVELLANTLMIAMGRGYEFSLFLDDIALANNEALKGILRQKSNHNNIICSKDLFVLLDSDESIFSNIVGVADRTVLLSHGSHISCEMWSKYIGEYEKIDVARNTGGGVFQSGRWGSFAQSGQTMQDKREYKIKPEEINRLPQGQVFAYDKRNSDLIQANVAFQ